MKEHSFEEVFHLKGTHVNRVDEVKVQSQEKGILVLDGTRAHLVRPFYEHEDNKPSSMRLAVLNSTSSSQLICSIARN